MKQLSIMIKPASSLCNMRCRYCFYTDVSRMRAQPSLGRMDGATTRAVLEHILMDLEAGDSLTLSFQGGEPTLAGLAYFRQMIALTRPHAQRGIQLRYALQTNGLLLDEAWCVFLKEHDFLVGLSLDGPRCYHDANRLDEQGKGTFTRSLRAKAQLERAGVSYNILMVLTAQLARHPQQVWQFLTQHHIAFVQLIPCLGALDGGDAPQTLPPPRYGAFYIQLFDQWLLDIRRGQYRSIKLFDDLIHLLAFGQCNACGLTGQCRPQIIVEGDGSVYPCDFYALDEYQLGSLGNQSLRALYEGAEMRRFLTRPTQLPTQCHSCSHWAICGGGCKRMRQEVFCQTDRGTCGHKLFLDARRAPLEQLALQHRAVAQGT